VNFHHDSMNNPVCKLCNRFFFFRVSIVHFIRVVVQVFSSKKIVKLRQFFAVNKKKERKEILLILYLNLDLLAFYYFDLDQVSF
jgi:hypothetical protein